TLKTNEHLYRGAVCGIDSEGQIRSIATIEADIIRLAIEHYGGHISEISRRLGIGRTTLYRKLKEYGIDVTNFGGRRKRDPEALSWECIREDIDKKSA